MSAKEAFDVFWEEPGEGHIESSPRSQSHLPQLHIFCLRTRSRSLNTLFAGFTSFSLEVQAIVQIGSGYLTSPGRSYSCISAYPSSQCSGELTSISKELRLLLGPGTEAIPGRILRLPLSGEFGKLGREKCFLSKMRRFRSFLSSQHVKQKKLASTIRYREWGRASFKGYVSHLKALGFPVDEGSNPQAIFPLRA
ncbi:hypothetical protein ACFE04_008371 [Oxalis oulophora]